MPESLYYSVKGVLMATAAFNIRGVTHTVACLLAVALAVLYLSTNAKAILHNAQACGRTLLEEPL